MATAIKKLTLYGTATIALCILSSRSVKAQIGDDKVRSIELHEGPWITNFKNEVFIKSLLKCYSKSLSNQITSQEGSTTANLDWLKYDSVTIALIDSVSTAFSTSPQTNWTIEGKQIIMNLCLDYRMSLQLDKLAKKAYANFRKRYNKAED